MASAFELEIKRGIWHLVPPSTAATAENLDTGPDPTELPKVVDDDDLDRVLRDYLGVKLPHHRCCENHKTPWDAVHDAFFARSAVSVWKASRGMGGKSYTLSALTMAEALFLRADANILGGSGEQSKRILESIGGLWEFPGFPRHVMRSKEPGAQRQTTIWKNKIVALMASQTSVRGPHPQRLRLDEVDEMSVTILDSALGQPMSKGWVQSQVVMSSTHQYANGTMTEMLKRAAVQNWPVFEWCYRENLEPHGWLSMGEVARKRAILTVAMWDTEIELQEPSSEGRAFDTAKVEVAFVQRVPASVDKELVIIEPPDPEGQYGHGSDWAKKKNHSVTVTMRKDVTPVRVVAIRREQKKPWPDMVANAEKQVLMYGGTWVHDNTGLGQVVHDLISGVDAEAFDMVGRQRAELLSEYISSVEHGELEWPRDDSAVPLAAAYAEHKYATREDIYKGSKDGSGKHHLPDIISAGAFAWRACGGVSAASGVRQPEPTENKNLQRGVERGRLSGYVRGKHLANSVESDEDDDGDE